MRFESKILLGNTRIWTQIAAQRGIEPTGEVETDLPRWLMDFPRIAGPPPHDEHMPYEMTYYEGRARGMIRDELAKLRSLQRVDYHAVLYDPNSPTWFRITSANSRDFLMRDPSTEPTASRVMNFVDYVLRHAPLTVVRTNLAIVEVTVRSSFESPDMMHLLRLAAPPRPWDRVIGAPMAQYSVTLPQVVDMLRPETRGRRGNATLLSKSEHRLLATLVTLEACAVSSGQMDMSQRAVLEALRRVNMYGPGSGFVPGPHNYGGRYPGDMFNGGEDSDEASDGESDGYDSDDVPRRAYDAYKARNYPAPPSPALTGPAGKETPRSSVLPPVLEGEGAKPVGRWTRSEWESHFGQVREQVEIEMGAEDLMSSDDERIEEIGRVAQDDQEEEEEWSPGSEYEEDDDKKAVTLDKLRRERPILWASLFTGSNPTTGFRSSWYRNSTGNITFKSLMRRIESKGYPWMVEHAPGLQLVMRDYQMEGVAWMLDRELVNRDEHLKLWEEVQVKARVSDGKHVHTDRHSVFWSPCLSVMSPSRPDRVRGGILADEMGLGKTLQVIALILLNPLVRETDPPLRDETVAVSDDGGAAASHEITESDDGEREGEDGDGSASRGDSHDGSCERAESRASAKSAAVEDSDDEVVVLDEEGQRDEARGERTSAKALGGEDQGQAEPLKQPVVVPVQFEAVTGAAGSSKYDQKPKDNNRRVDTRQSRQSAQSEPGVAASGPAKTETDDDQKQPVGSKRGVGTRRSRHSAQSDPGGTAADNSKSETTKPGSDAQASKEVEADNSGPATRSRRPKRRAARRLISYNLDDVEDGSGWKSKLRSGPRARTRQQRRTEASADSGTDAAADEHSEEYVGSGSDDASGSDAHEAEETPKRTPRRPRRRAAKRSAPVIEVNSSGDEAKNDTNSRNRDDDDEEFVPLAAVADGGGDDDDAEDEDEADIPWTPDRASRKKPKSKTRPGSAKPKKDETAKAPPSPGGEDRKKLWRAKAQDGETPLPLWIDRHARLLSRTEFPGKLQSRATIIVCPVSLLGQWGTEIVKCTQADSLNVLKYHSPQRRKIPLVKLMNADVILTTYEILARDILSSKTVGTVAKATKARPYGSMEFRKAQAKAKAVRGTIERLPINKLSFHRIVYDEVQKVKSTNSASFAAALELKGTTRWLVTGTPVSTNIRDLHSMFKLLKLYPLSGSKFEAVASAWDRHLDEAKELLLSVLSTITMRRTKKGVGSQGLPERREETMLVKFARAEEEKAYVRLEANLRARFEMLAARGYIGRQYAKVMSLLLQLREAASNSITVADRAAGRQMGTLDVSPEELLENDANSIARVDLATFVLLKASSASPGLKAHLDGLSAVPPKFGECAACEDILQRPCVTGCGHVFCRRCLLELVQTPGKPRCPDPTCKVRLTRTLGGASKPKPITELVFAKNDKSTSDDDGAGSDEGGAGAAGDGEDEDEPLSQPGGELSKIQAVKLARKKAKKSAPKTKKARKYCSKVNAVVDRIRKLIQRNSTNKFVVLTDFASVFDQLQSALKDEGISSTALKGSSTQRSREKSLISFQGHGGASVFIATMRAGAMGLTLTAANFLFLMEPTLNMGRELQAMGRVHRLGQLRPVTIVRVVQQDTVEARIRYVMATGQALSSSGQSDTGSTSNAAAVGLKLTAANREAAQALATAALQEKEEIHAKKGDHSARRLAHRTAELGFLFGL